MEDDVKNRLDHIDKRLDDFKTYVAGTVGLITLIFGLATILLSLNFNSEKTDLHQFKTELKEELLGMTGKPDIELLGENEQSLDNQDVVATVEPVKSNDGGTAYKLSFRYIIKNKGSSSSSQLFAKLYASEPLTLGETSADERNYKYETYLTAEQIKPNPLPAGAAVMNIFFVTLTDRPRAGKSPAMLKFFYGRDKPATATFQIVITEP